MCKPAPTSVRSPSSDWYPVNRAYANHIWNRTKCHPEPNKTSAKCPAVPPSVVLIRKDAILLAANIHHQWVASPSHGETVEFIWSSRDHYYYYYYYYDYYYYHYYYYYWVRVRVRVLLLEAFWSKDGMVHLKVVCRMVRHFSCRGLGHFSFSLRWFHQRYAHEGWAQDGMYAEIRSYVAPCMVLCFTVMHMLLRFRQYFPRPRQKRLYKPM